MEAQQNIIKAKSIEELTDIEAAYVKAKKAVDYLSWLGLIKEPEWERINKRVTDYGKRYNLDDTTVPATLVHYCIDLGYTLGHAVSVHQAQKEKE